MNAKDVQGLKKPPLRLVPPVLLLYVSRAMAHGVKKYQTPYNWREAPVRHTVYLEAAMRHLLQALDGEDVDAESGLPHEAHVAACMAILLDAHHAGSLEDDRHKSGALRTLMPQLTEP